MEEKTACKIWSLDGTVKKLVTAKTFSELMEKVKQKLNCPEGRLCLPDGTEIDDDEGLTAARDLSSVPVFTFVPVGKDFTTKISSLAESPSVSMSLPSSFDLTYVSELESSNSDLSASDTIILPDSSPLYNNVSDKDESPRCETTPGQTTHDIALPTFSHMFRNSLRMKEPPLPSEKRGAAKAIADQMIAKHLSGRRVFRDFALRVVALSPDSFSTELGNGVDSFACLIENAYYNHPSMRLQSKSNIRSDLYAPGTSGRKRKGVDLKESYGCTNWQPSNLPRGETKESQEEKRKILKTEFSKLSQNANKVGNLMKATYVTQRFEINKKPTKPLCELREEWPYLFLTPFYDNHFYELTSTSYKTFQNNLTKKVGPLYKFLCDTKQGKFSKKWQQKIKEAKESEENEQCVTLAAVFMLCEYFGEDKDVMFKEVEEDADFSTFKTDLPSPCVVYAGCNPFLRNRMAITVDREPLLYPTSIIAALKMLFMSYYVFNICYPTEVQATMEYMQRILFEIDPGRGSRAKKSYRWCINPKVTSLCERMKESRE